LVPEGLLGEREGENGGGRGGGRRREEEGREERGDIHGLYLKILNKEVGTVGQIDFH
jgi:hypothetical protein